MFGNVNDAIRHTCAHEAGHAVSLKHPDTETDGQIMRKYLEQGSYLSNGLFNTWNNLDKAGFNAK